MKKIAFVTSTASPGIAADDAFLRGSLNAHAIEVVGAAWDDPAVDWRTFDLLLIRSCWNYHLAPENFRKWIDSIRSSNVTMFNPAELILWNMNKNYLKELKEKGVAVPDSIWIREQEFYPDLLMDTLSRRRWNRGVLKPCVSASSFRTIVVTEINAQEEGRKLSEQFPAGGMIFQKFEEEIPRGGELSVVFFNGEYSHSVIKQAMPGEFRVQQEFGGKSSAVSVEPKVLASAAAILDKLPVTPLYARVDGFPEGDTFKLVELELIEPVLFFAYAPEASARLARHVRALV